LIFSGVGGHQKKIALPIVDNAMTVTARQGQYAQRPGASPGYYRLRCSHNRELYLRDISWSLFLKSGIHGLIPGDGFP